MLNHSELPWEVKKIDNTPASAIFSNLDVPIAGVWLAENASFIVRACNNHEKLLEVLKHAEKEVNKWHSLNVADDDKENEKNAWAVLKQIDSAIQSAEGL